MKNLYQKKILLIICGGIAAYKSLELIRLFKKMGASVKTVVTKNAKKFVTDLSIASLSQDKVYSDLFNHENEAEMDHISLSRWADIIVIAPATAKIDFDGDSNEKIMAESRLYSGTVTNTGLDRADFVRIIYQLWGGETDLISSDSTFIEGTQMVYQSGIITDTALRPGETAEFFLEIKSPSDKKVQYVTRDIHWDTYE